MHNYGIELWANNNFIIDKGLVKLNNRLKPSLLEISKKIQAEARQGPVLLRFPELIQQQIEQLFSNFKFSINDNNYKGNFYAVYPLKVNQNPQVVDSIIDYGKKYRYGLEAGSKAELILAMDKTPLGSPITVNGFKDTDMITLGFIAAQMGHNITLIIEGINELKMIIDVAKKTKLTMPKVGIRIRLHSKGSGTWERSGGINSKFGLTSTELLESILLLQKNDLLDFFTMLHFHIGSQIEDITTVKKALREVGNIYAELKKMGAENLSALNIGGGLAVEYAQHKSQKLTNYDLREFSNDVIFLIGEIMDRKEVAHPDIYTESGRFIVASHAVLIAPVLELFSQDYNKRQLNLAANNPPLIDELKVLYDELSAKNCIEYLHDALDHIESLLTLFDLGYISLQDRSNAEILVHQIIKKSLYFYPDGQTPELECLQTKLQERYLINSSFFQSLPDFWGLQQQFPVMPIHKLDQKSLRAASLWDITCDSDGEIPFNSDAPLYLHDVDIETEDYCLAFFNVGAYQETLGMKHNLFSKPTECSITFNEKDYLISELIHSESIQNTMLSLGYHQFELLNNLKEKLGNAHYKNIEEQTKIVDSLRQILLQNCYLNTN
jgi:arginine decarboxylase